MLQKLFGFDPAEHKVRTEIYAGITTFLKLCGKICGKCGKIGENTGGSEKSHANICICGKKVVNLRRILEVEKEIITLTLDPRQEKILHG